MSFRHLRREGSLLWVEEGFADAAIELDWPQPGALADAFRAGVSGSSGRAETRILELPGHGERLHLRRLRHGGWLRFAWSDRVLGPGRGRHELEIGSELRRRGAPVPTPILLLAERAGPLFRAALGTAHVEDAADGAQLLASRPTRERMLRATRAAGRAVRRFHDAGGRHADLHVANLLFREEGRETQALVIDLDRARVGPAPAASRRMQELMRLYRSLLKRELQGALGLRGCVAFFAAYIDGDRALRRAMLACMRRERLRVALHARGYRRSPAIG